MPYTLKRRERPGSVVGIKDQNVEKSGVPLDVNGDRVTLSPPDNHCIVIAASGRGKTRRVMYPSVILSARAHHSIVCLDPKGEIYRATAAEVRKCGLDVKVLNLRDPDCGSRWNPLALVQGYWNSGDQSRALVMLKDVGTLITDSIATERDGYWRASAINCFVGFATLILERNMPLTFDSIHSLACDWHAKTELRSLFRDRINSESEGYRALSTLLSLESDVTIGCVMSEFDVAISRYADLPSVRDLLAESDFDISEIGCKPMAVFLVVPDESTALHPIASMFIEEAYSELIRIADNREDNMLPVAVDFYIDVFGSVVGNDWVSKLTAARSRRIRFVLAVQDFSQLVKRYDESGAQTLLSNARTIIYLGGKDIRMMSLLSAFGGSEHDRYGIAHPRITSDCLAGLPECMAVIVDDSGRPWYGHLPDWSRWDINERSELMQLKRERLPHITLTVEHIIEDENPFADERDINDPGDLALQIPEPTEEDVAWSKEMLRKLGYDVSEIEQRIRAFVKEER